METLKNIAVVIVTYNPNILLLKKEIKELKNIGKIVVFDNNSLNQKEITDMVTDYNNLVFIKGKANVGIAKAQNISIKRAEKLDFIQQFLFLDDDSFVKESTIKNLLIDYNYLIKNRYKIASISLTVKSNNKGSKFSFVDKTISSGTLISRSVFNKIGLFYEPLFIDMVDYEWCWRARKTGMCIVRDNDCNFVHQIGSTNYVFGRIPVAAPFRLYYVFRNTIFLVKNGKTMMSKKEMYKIFLKQIVFNCVFCAHRIQRLKFIIKGIKDGEVEKLGKL